MRMPSRRSSGALLLAAVLVPASLVRAAPYEQQSTTRRAVYTTVAMAANVLPVLSALYAPRCLSGYVVCKLVFAGVSLIAAAEQVFLSGDAHHAQTRAILYRGLAGDWYLTGAHIAGDRTPQPLPEPPPPVVEDRSGAEGDWEPPPI
jgi:hypothetical protein